MVVIRKGPHFAARKRCFYMKPVPHEPDIGLHDGERFFGVERNGGSGGIAVSASAELGGHGLYVVLTGGTEAGLDLHLAVFFLLAQHERHTNAGKAPELFHYAFGIFAGGIAACKILKSDEGSGQLAVFQNADFLHDASPQAQPGFAPVVFHGFAQFRQLQAVFQHVGHETHGSRRGVGVAEVAGVCGNGHVQRFGKGTLQRNAQSLGNVRHKFTGGGHAGFHPVGLCSEERIGEMVVDVYGGHAVEQRLKCFSEACSVAAVEADHEIRLAGQTVQS